MSDCCVPASTPRGAPVTAPYPAAGRQDLTDMVELPGGEFRMGTDYAGGFPADGETPVRLTTVDPFAIDELCVTNTRFAEFVDATGYRTDAERFGWSYVFAGFLPAGIRRVSPRPEATPWWCGVQGAYWLRPEGPGSSIENRWSHPVVHVSWRDAMAYCRWSGRRLPRETEWEYAARGGLDQRLYPWGDELTPDGVHRCNIWQGRFPVRNSAEDGYRGTAPADAYEPNGFGLYNVAGNVWEWCEDSFTDGYRVMRGGSYLCHESYCNRYRVAARTGNSPDSSAGNIGFRTVADV